MEPEAEFDAKLKQGISLIIKNWPILKLAIENKLFREKKTEDSAPIPKSAPEQIQKLITDLHEYVVGFEKIGVRLIFFKGLK